MNARLFNLTLLLGWLLVLAGGMLINLGAGLAVGGALLIALAFSIARIAGIYMPTAKEEGHD